MKLSDLAARNFAIDPRHNVVLEASAGTGKTSVLVRRYLNLLRAEVDPSNVLAITFTRQAAAEMRERIITQLRAESVESAVGRTHWNAIRDRLGEISISTVDAFCLSLLREFPLEADIDPEFTMVDETEVPRLVENAVERTLAIGAVLANDDPTVAMLLAKLGPWRARAALTNLLERRLVVPSALHRFLAAAPRDLTADRVAIDAVRRLADRVNGARRELELMIETGPPDDPSFSMVVRDLQRISTFGDSDQSAARSSLDRIREFFLTRKGTVRSEFSRGAKLEGPVGRQYREAARALASLVHDVLRGFDRDVNIVMTRAVQRLFGIAVSEYQRDLAAHARLDFSDVLQRAIELLRQMDEFARSRYRLESRYHHVLVDEFQDTSRAQWELVSLLVKTWGEGSGLVDEAVIPPTIFIVGDRKQSIYRFRDADVSILQSAADEVARLRPDGDVRRSISHSFRAVRGLLSFLNDLFDEIGTSSNRRDGFRYESHDRFPVGVGEDDTHDEAEVSQPGDRVWPLGAVVADDLETCAVAVAAEIERLLRGTRVRTTDSSGERAIRPADIAILFRARESHREFDCALERRSIPTHVYKGVGFFDADEVKDLRALIRFLANPSSELRAAALLRSRFARVSDPALAALASRLSESLVADKLPAGAELLQEDDLERLLLLRRGVKDWLDLVDRLPPAEILDRALLDASYARELYGPHVVQARENLKKMRALVRKLQNKGYATMARVADQIDHLSNDIATAVVEAFDAVQLMTVHAAKGLEFPVVFLVDLGRGTGTHVPAVRVVPDRGDGEPSVTVWPYHSEVDKDKRPRDLEETKRLLYVACTRARDQLYLSTVLSGGSVKFNRGSFGEVLPEGFASVFEDAANLSVDLVRWQGRSGQTHELRALSTIGDTIDGAPASDQPERLTMPTVRVDLSRLIGPMGVTRAAVTAAVSPEARIPRSNGEHMDGAEREPLRLLGRTVHVLLQRFLGRRVPKPALTAHAMDLLRCELPLQPEVTSRLARRSVELYHRFSEHADVIALQDQKCLFEVPFSFHKPRLRSRSRPAAGAGVVIGTIDCLARAQDGRVTVLEFKTGSPRPEHDRQLEQYVAAARVIFPDTIVEGRLVYPYTNILETDRD